VNNLNQDNHQQRVSFSSRIGYVMAAAGSAVGLGNIWRFPYLAAKYGGGTFLIVYLILVYTFGYTMIMSETTLGRMTQKSPVGAFKHFGKSFSYKFGGWINAVIPMIIVSYYSVIGGWVLKYLVGYVVGQTQAMANDAFFPHFIGQSVPTEIYFLIFTAITILVILIGVQKGIERISKIGMPVLIVLGIFVAIYSMTRPGAVAGIKYFFIPNFHNFSWMTIVAAMGQMFYSLSIAMGILYTFGSYLTKNMDIEKSTSQVEFFDTAIAILAGLMIIPAVFAFSGGTPKALQVGPSLMFITIPKVFASMGLGTIAGVAFFLLVFIAALTSAIALAESAVSTFEDELGMGRIPATLLITAIIVGLGSLSSLGYSVLGGIKILGMDFLDFFDFISNSVMMPIAAIATCVLILRRVSLQAIADEIKISSEFKRQRIYNLFIKYFCIIFLAVILVSSVLNVFGIIKM
jgi:NSS family neurotransmitter:Na+ symporter